MSHKVSKKGYLVKQLVKDKWLYVDGIGVFDTKREADTKVKELKKALPVFIFKITPIEYVEWKDLSQGEKILATIGHGIQKIKER